MVRCVHMKEVHLKTASVYIFNIFWFGIEKNKYLRQQYDL